MIQHMSKRSNIRAADKLEVLGDHAALLMEKTAGDYFGEIALVRDDAVRTAWVRAKSYCILAALTKAKMAKAFEANPVFRALFLSRGGSGEVGLLKS